jgi:hypothetical protein
MKYKSISLNSNYSLVKYNYENEKGELEELKNVSKEIASSPKFYPQFFDKKNEQQSYMILRNSYNCVGAINIETSNDESNLKIKVQLNENYFKSQQEIIEVVEQLIDTIMGLFNKENIKINLINNIDLTKVNPQKYRKMNYDDALITCIRPNKSNASLITKLVNEVNESEKCLTDLGLSWHKSIETMELKSEFDTKLLKSIDDSIIALPELFNKFRTLYWTEINSIKSTRFISFSRNGYIEYSKDSKNRKNGIDYEFAYNVLSDGFNLKISSSQKDSKIAITDIEENSHYANIKTNQLNIIYNKETKRKKINYTSPIINNSSIVGELWTNEQNEIENCYVDLRTHKSKGKINGLYAIRISKHQNYNKISIRFISRKGNKNKDFSEDISTNEEKLYSTIIDGKITIELIDELIKKVILLVNNSAGIYKKQPIVDPNETIFSNFVDIETQAINFIKQIKGEIPLPHLQENLEKFVNENSKSKKDNTMTRILK